MVVAVKGTELPGGDFQVEELVLPGFPPQPSRIGNKPALSFVDICSCLTFNSHFFKCKLCCLHIWHADGGRKSQSSAPANVRGLHHWPPWKHSRATAASQGCSIDSSRQFCYASRRDTGRRAHEKLSEGMSCVSYSLLCQTMPNNNVIATIETLQHS